MKYISLKAFATQLNTRPLIALFLVMRDDYHYIMTEDNGMWVLTSKNNEPITNAALYKN